MNALFAGNSIAVSELGVFFAGNLLLELAGKSVVMVAAAYDRCAAVTGDGLLYQWGMLDSKFVRLGPGAQVERAVFGGQDVRQVSIGQNHTMVLVGVGVVFTHESSGVGRGSTRTVLTQVAGPPAFVNVRAVFVAAGKQSSHVLAHDNSMWAWGGNTCGELGLGDTTARGAPTQLAPFGDAPVVLISARSHVVAVLRNSALFVWGSNTHGQLGTGKLDDCVLPTHVPFAGAVAAASGDNHTLVLQDGGAVYACGGYAHGALGHCGGDAPPEYLAELTLVPGLSRVMSVTAGLSTSAAVTEDGKLYAWGKGSYEYLVRWWPNYTKEHESGTPALRTLEGRVGRHGHLLPKLFAVAFAMATHKRLGAASMLYNMPQELVQRLLEACALPPPAGLFEGIARQVCGVRSSASVY